MSFQDAIYTNGLKEKIEKSKKKIVELESENVRLREITERVGFYIRNNPKTLVNEIALNILNEVNNTCKKQ